MKYMCAVVYIINVSTQTWNIFEKKNMQQHSCRPNQPKIKKL